MELEGKARVSEPVGTSPGDQLEAQRGEGHSLAFCLIKASIVECLSKRCMSEIPKVKLFRSRAWLCGGFSALQCCSGSGPAFYSWPVFTFSVCVFFQTSLALLTFPPIHSQFN